MTMIASTTPGTHNPRISAQTVTNRLLEICERPPYTMYVLHAAFLFWPSICTYERALEVKREGRVLNFNLFCIKSYLVNIKHSIVL